MWLCFLSCVICSHGRGLISGSPRVSPDTSSGPSFGIRGSGSGFGTGVQAQFWNRSSGSGFGTGGSGSGFGAGASGLGFARGGLVSGFARGGLASGFGSGGCCPGSPPHLIFLGPTVETNIAFIRAPEQGQGLDPIVIPPSRQEHIVYTALNAASQGGGQVVGGFGGRLQRQGKERWVRKWKKWIRRIWGSSGFGESGVNGGFVVPRGSGFGTQCYQGRFSFTRAPSGYQCQRAQSVCNMEHYSGTIFVIPNWSNKYPEVPDINERLGYPLT
ncbi:uncharacterized protein LOC119570501 [Penaeus monodon]|uniref:uncharacterized protein LOC119570501 n=1 Tax=Penaeus monodon TaxID=6687 RepID=UPI0018A745F5|nr:uncharacterized protein LOC119570501 [Penaeus monodon]